jgi:hypothetical protein
MSSEPIQTRLPRPIDLVEGNSRYIVEELGPRASKSERQAANAFLEMCGAIREARDAGRVDDGLAWAMNLGLLLGKLTGRQGRSGGRVRGITIAAKAEADDQRVERLCRRYDASDDLQEQHRTRLAYLASATGESKRNLQRRLNRLRQNSKPVRGGQ